MTLYLLVLLFLAFAAAERQETTPERALDWLSVRLTVAVVEEAYATIVVDKHTAKTRHTIRALAILFGCFIVAPIVICIEFTP